MVNRIYLPELLLNKANTSDTEAPFLDLYLSISNGFVLSKIYDTSDTEAPFLDLYLSISHGFVSSKIYDKRAPDHCLSFYFAYQSSCGCAVW